MRGGMTAKAQSIGKAFLGREMLFRELRLLPYIQYVMMNEQRLDINKINQEEMEILRLWKDAGHVEGGATGLSITKEFWDFMCEVLFETYVANRDEIQQKEARK